MNSWHRINDLFDRAIDLPPQERESFLNAETDGEPAIRAQVERLLSEVSSAGNLISAIVRNAHEPGQPLQSDTIGPYRLIRELGRGGMGSVWLAERADGEFTQQVAIKRVKFGLASEELIRRFRHERQILSVLNHPNICRLLDGGATDHNEPYLVMEYVDGATLSSYVSEHKPSQPQLLSLFLTICSAVQHAHSNLIIHRDLKPSNILVTATGTVKLLDFGIARLLEASPGNEQTQTALQAFTPAFASPEQKLQQPQSTASDIYSLGKILAHLIPTPDRDLASIIAKATREEPSARYLSVAQFVDDLEHYRSGEAVQARQGNFQYHAAKFLNRHRWATATAAAFLVLILAFSFWTALQNRRIQQARDRAESVAQFLSSLFAAADPERNQGNRVSTRELLDLGALRIRDSVSDPVTQSQLLDTIGEAYFHLGLYDRAIPMLEDVLARYQAQDAGPSTRQTRIIGWLAESETSRGHFDAGDRWALLGLSTARAIRPTDNGTIARALRSRCAQLHHATKDADATKACQEAASLSGSLSPNDRAAIQITLGTALKDSNNLPGAEAAFQSAIQLSGGSGTLSNSLHAQALSELATVYFRQGRMPDAETAFRTATAFKRKLYPEGHLDLARTLNNQANAVGSLRKYPEAIQLFTEAHQMYRRFLGPESSELASSLSNYAVILAAQGNLKLAEDTLREVIGMQERTIGPGKRPLLASQLKLAALMIESKKYAEAAPLLSATIAAYERLDTIPQIEFTYCRTLLAIAWLESRQPARALPLAASAEATFNKILKNSHWMRELATTAHAGALIQAGQRTQAASMLAPLVAAYKKSGANTWRVALTNRYAQQAGL